MEGGGGIMQKKRKERDKLLDIGLIIVDVSKITGSFQKQKKREREGNIFHNKTTFIFFFFHTSFLLETL